MFYYYQNRCQMLESQNAELNGINVELNAKMEKYRKGYKEQSKLCFIIPSYCIFIF